MRFFSRSTLLLLLALTLSLPALAEEPQWGPDVKSGHDHPLVQRFTGSWLIGYAHKDWDEVILPASPEVNDDDTLKNTVTLEGQITDLVYLAPQGKSPLEVYRNYEAALKEAGLQTIFETTIPEKDADLYFAWQKTIDWVSGIMWEKTGDITSADHDSSYSFTSAPSYDGGRMLYGTISKDGRETHVFLYTCYAAGRVTDKSMTFLRIVEPKAMPTGQVTINAASLGNTLTTQGKVAIYGLYFDTAQAVIKPESKAQLDEMAALLKAQPALKVFIVGHTDNQGPFDGNMALSQARAEAVKAALTGTYGIEAARLTAKGVASLAPVASNADEAGRGRNRRVELVLP